MNKILFSVIGLLLVGAVVFGSKELTRRSVSGNIPSDTEASTPVSTSETPLPTKPTTAQESQATSNPPAQTHTTATPTSYTMAQIQTHNSASNCWSAISDSVYNLTSFVSKHPGGERAILKICGADGTRLFMDQHGGMEKQAAMLATFKIGTLTH